MDLDRRPIGYFIHHQGRGHAVRAASVVNALPSTRPVVLFAARGDLFPPLRPGVEIRVIPSLFEPTGAEPDTLDWVPTPQTTHCAPLGWATIRTAMAEIAGWFRDADPVLMISDVSAEIAQLSRICSVPHVCVLQHGDRSDPGHRAAFDGAAGLLAPFHADLAQPDWSEEMRARTCFAGGLGVDADMPERDAARARLGLGDRRLVLAVSGGGGDGLADAPLGVGARSFPDTDWVSIGRVRRDWHATPPANLAHMGWVDTAPDWIVAADVVIASTGNTTCQQILSAARPWIAVPEWRYFDEQVKKAEALASAGAAHHLPSLPSSAHAWRAAMTDVLSRHDPARQTRLCDAAPDCLAADWIEHLVRRLWSPVPVSSSVTKEPPVPQDTVSVLTIARGREAHLANVVRGLAAQTVLPTEFIVSVMQDELYELPNAPFPIRQIKIEAGEELPLAEARNTAAAAASGEVLVFLDVDCIPHPELVGDYIEATQAGGIAMGEVLYLPGNASESGIDIGYFDRVAVRHSDRRGPPEKGLDPCEDYRCFWSLNFALRRGDWNMSGGFDPRFRGYGGEDTDFGRTVAEKGLPIWWARGARVYHQYHPHAMPPVHHVASVVRNAELFAEKWGHRTMEHWLHAFRMMGLIENTPHGLRILRDPDARDMAICRQQSDQPYASTRRVIDLLEEATGDEHARRRDVEAAQADMLRVAAE